MTNSTLTDIAYLSTSIILLLLPLGIVIKRNRIKKTNENGKMTIKNVKLRHALITNVFSSKEMSDVCLLIYFGDIYNYKYLYLILFL